ncbi:diguanylate cyclase [Actinoplanes sp. CA-142083]|uniref:GGDEF domain-containing protein n=1 Tax=Actinoplanes sp. CA-142083 TaxID=3239903 RepID=UPI003D8E8C5C
MTLRGRLTAAFLVVVLGPVLLGSIFVALTVATVSRERAAERLDHAATTVRTGISAICRQLQAAADAVAVVSADDRSAVARQLVARGLASDIQIFPSGSGEESKPSRTGDCAAPAGTDTSAIVATATVAAQQITAAQAVDDAFLARLAAASGARITLGGNPGAGGRELSAGPGQPLPLTLTVSRSKPLFLYGVLLAVVIAAGFASVLVARWLAHTTTRPLGDLAWAADQVAGGDLDTRVPIVRPDELGRLAATFNRMTRELKAYVQALTASRDQLRGHLAILGETLSSTHDVDRILQVILRTALAATGARSGLVLLLDPAGGQLVARCAIGLTGAWDLPDDKLATMRLPVGSGVLGAVAAAGEPRRGHGELASTEPPCRTYVAVPIRAPVVDDPLLPSEPTPATLGVLALYDRVGGDDFDDADLRTLRTFAGQAGVAVHNVRVHEEAQRLSLTDPLTGLWNYRYLRESLRREVERASRFGRMLAVLVLDLDHFKEVNDTYGHAAGDAVLGEFARRIRIGLREVDVAFRQGGEEFVVLLPETDAYGGAIVAERLGAVVRDRPVPIEGRGAIPVTVSIGVAVFPEHGADAQRVLQAADDALYAAKSAGRDTYRLADPSVGVPTGGPQPPRQAHGR